MDLSRKPGECFKYLFPQQERLVETLQMGLVGSEVKGVTRHACLQRTEALSGSLERQECVNLRMWERKEVNWNYLRENPKQKTERSVHSQD